MNPQLRQMNAGIGLFAVVASLSLGLLLLGLADGGVVIRGEITCPSPAAVAERLLPLLGEASSEPPHGSIELAEIAGGGPGLPRQISMRLVRNDGGAASLLGSIPRSGSCEDAANDVAVFLAACWGTQYPTPVAEDLTLAEPPASPPPPAGPTTPRAGGDVVAAQVSRWSGSVGVAAGALRGGISGGVTAQASIDVTLDFSMRWLGRAAAWASGERDLAVASGNAIWRRIGLSVSGGRRWYARGHARGQANALHVEATTGVTAAYSRVRGVGFLDNHATGSVDMGVVAAGRLGWAPGRLPIDVWLELGVSSWVTPHQVIVGGLSESRFLPWLEGVVLVGASYHFGD